MRPTRIPTAFYDDHTQRDLPAPPVMWKTTRHYVIDADHPDASELLEDAEFYSDVDGPIGGQNAHPSYLGLRRSATMTVAAIKGAK